MSFEPEFQAAIERHYNLKIKQAIPGPRQFVAETYIFECTDGNRYFCKMVDKPLFIPDIVAGLPAVEEMHKCGIDRISYPIRGKSGLHLYIGNTLVYLMNFIPAQQSYDYSPFAFGRLTAQIHAISAEMQYPAPREDFAFPNKELFRERFEGVLTSKSDDPVLQAFQKVLRQHEPEILEFAEEFNRLAKICSKKQRAMVLTHGDAPGNVLVKSPDDIYIIDWDELSLAPPERDMWMIDHFPEFMEGYKSVFPDFIQDADMRSFCVLKYYFQRSMHYFSEILKETAPPSERFKHLEKLEYELEQGWMQPKLEDVLKNRKERTSTTEFQMI